MEVSESLYNLIEEMGKVEKRAVKSQLIRLISHIIKWKCQPERRSSSWVITITSARREIKDSQDAKPSLNREFIESIWEKGFIKAVKDAEDEMNINCEITSLSWEEVFEEEYSLLAEY
jgi:hypothetical protein